MSGSHLSPPLTTHRSSCFPHGHPHPLPSQCLLSLSPHLPPRRPVETDSIPTAGATGPVKSQPIKSNQFGGSHRPARKPTNQISLEGATGPNPTTKKSSGNPRKHTEHTGDTQFTRKTAQTKDAKKKKEKTRVRPKNVFLTQKAPFVRYFLHNESMSTIMEIDTIRYAYHLFNAVRLVFTPSY